MKVRGFLLVFFLWGGCTQNQDSTTVNGSYDISEALLSGTIVDLTYAYDSSTIYWPTEDGFQLNEEAEGFTDKGYYYTANSFCGAEHGGTHLDAPIHFAEGQQAVDAIPLENLIGSGVIVDVQDSAGTNPDYQVSVDDFEAWETRQGQLPEGSIVFLRTGYGQYWPDRMQYMGTDERGAEAVEKLHFPGLHPEAANWLIENRNIKAIGIDTPSIDFGQSTHFETHQALFQANIPAFENLANLEQLAFQGFTVIALPMKIGGGSGAPLRVIAIHTE
ncbi:kynurenine formamidase [Catalinimonas alkaloidigena]|uniref:cyclase family protein n=1 Tax=Catalinimonas alkaloidigena TaxID=1075417 RepID=UPI002405A70F|nr:cyclase family protein [Catalinimonas alkaloidigena]MDF9798260.1 kynurenine formamidase [Catalinimonas alkaloidigena]